MIRARLYARVAQREYPPSSVQHPKVVVIFEVPDNDPMRFLLEGISAGGDWWPDTIHERLEDAQAQAEVFLPGDVGEWREIPLEVPDDEDSILVWALERELESTHSVPYAAMTSVSKHGVVKARQTKFARRVESSSAIRMLWVERRRTESQSTQSGACDGRKKELRGVPWGLHTKDGMRESSSNDWAQSVSYLTTRFGTSVTREKPKTRLPSFSI